MKLNTLLAGIPIAERRGQIDEDVEIRRISHDSREIETGDIFVAIEGVLADGHDYVAQAKEKGAYLAVVEKFVEADIPQVRVENTRKALADLACIYFDHPSRQMEIFGVTATNGKTSTAFMVRDIFKAAGYRVGMVGTVAVQYGDVSIPAILTTPESIHLQEHLRNMADAGIEVVVMEVSSSAQELYRSRGIEFDIVSFNNISVEHLEQHGTFENYFHYKSRLIRHADEDTAVLLNVDAPLIAALAEDTKGQVFTAAIDEEAMARIEGIDISTGFAEFTYRVARESTKGRWTLPSVEIPVHLQVAGYHSVLNAMMAMTFGLLGDVDPQTVRRAMEEFSGVERRFELIYRGDYMILDDHFANTKNIEVTLETLHAMEYKNLHILYAIRGSRGAELNRENAVETAKWMARLPLKTFYATKSVEAVSSKDVVTDAELEAFQNVMQDAGYEIPVIERLDDSIRRILPAVESGDVLLLAGCQGMDHAAKVIWQDLADRSRGEEKTYWLQKIDNRIC